MQFWCKCLLVDPSGQDAGDAGVREVLVEVAGTLEAAGGAADESGEAEDNAEQPAAPQRFAAAVQASLLAAKEAGIQPSLV